MRNENIVKCEICTTEFDNAYRKRLRKKACSEDCYYKLKNKRRHKDIYVKRKKRWQENIKKECCGECGKKVKPITKIPSRCRGCQDKINDYYGKKNIKRKRNNGRNKKR